MTKILYFSWIRGRLGMGEEMLDIPGEIKTVGEFLNWQKTRGEEFEAVLEIPEIVRVAVDHEHRDHDELLGEATEIALFPPMTGG